MTQTKSRLAAVEPTRIDLDKAGATASLACAVHCALMPLVVTLLPLVGLGFLADERTEWALLGLSAPAGVKQSGPRLPGTPKASGFADRSRLA